MARSLLTLSVLLLCASWTSAKIIKSDNGKLIANEFIVVLQPEASDLDRFHHFQRIRTMDPEARVLHLYDHTIVGYSLRAQEFAVDMFSEDRAVAYVEQNHEAWLVQNCLVGTPNPPAGLWGLSRVSYPEIQIPPAPVRYSDFAGADVYIIDTGINYGHVDFCGRAQFAFDSTGEGPDDGNGHGSHCAGTAVGTTFGVSKKAKVWAVKVLNAQGSGSYAGVIAGVDFVGGRSGNRVASMSLGGGFSQSMNDAIARLGAKGNVAIAIASGNSGDDACRYSPASARSPAALTVNALDQPTAANKSDRRAGFSNYGNCTHLFAPGVNILSAWIGSPNATNTISGTSMATPHVASVLSDLWGRFPQSTGAQICQKVLDLALNGRVQNAGTGSPNKLAQDACAAGGC